MSDGQYLLPLEAAAMMLFLVGPPLFLALAVQTWFFLRRGMLTRPGLLRVVLAYALTCVGTFALSVPLLATATGRLGAVLGYREVPLAGGQWPFFPGAFVVAGVIAAIALTFTARHSRSEG